MSKKKKHKLQYKLDMTFYLLGISSSENDYRLTWKINKKLNIRLRKSTDHLVQKKGVTQKFLLYRYSDDETYLDYFIVGNKSENGFLIEELRNIDFFIQIHGTLDEEQKNKILSSLKKIEGISGVFNLDINNLRSKDNLILE